MVLEEIVNTIDEASQRLEEDGFEVVSFRSNLSGGGKTPAVGGTVEQAINQELNESKPTIGFDAYPHGVSHPDARISVSYKVAEDAFVVDHYLGPRLLDSEDIENLNAVAQTGKLEFANDKVIEKLEDEDAYEGVFEFDGVEAAVERTLMNEGYDVIVGDTYEDMERMSDSVSEFP